VAARGVHGRRDKPAGGLSPQALELVAQRFRALSDPSRLALLQALMEGERTVGELCAVCPCSQANVSRHLALLFEEGILSRRKEGQHVHYSIADATIQRLCELVCGSLSRRLDDLRDEFPAD
jgi:DNA-binding transcriptional ArsR family regulator